MPKKKKRSKYHSYVLLGAGAHGKVYSAKRRGEEFAVKVITGNLIRREIFALVRLKGEKGIVEFVSYFLKGVEVHLVMKKYPVNLFHLMNKHYASDNLTETFRYHVPDFLRQILTGLAACHEADIIHRDVNPNNILCRASKNYPSQVELALCDFGNSLLPDEKWNLKVDYCTRWYAAPETYEAKGIQGKPVDLWSVGCVLYHLLEGKVLFPGEEGYQLDTIIDIFGESDSKFSRRDLCPNFTDLGFDLLGRLLTWNSEQRITLDEALKHPYLQD